MVGPGTRTINPDRGKLHRKPRGVWKPNPSGGVVFAESRPDKAEWSVVCSSSGAVAAPGRERSPARAQGGPERASAQRIGLIPRALSRSIASPAWSGELSNVRGFKPCANDCLLGTRAVSWIWLRAGTSSGPDSGPAAPAETATVQTGSSTTAKSTLT